VKFRAGRAAIAALVATAALSVSVPAAEAAPIAGVRVCTTQEDWTFTPPLTISPALLGPTGIGISYTAYCPVRYEVDPFTPPFIFTSTQNYPMGQSYSYVGNCVLAALTGGSAAVGGGILVGGIVAVTVGAGGVANPTFNNVSVKVLVPSPDVCSESTASTVNIGQLGSAVTVGTL